MRLSPIEEFTPRQSELLVRTLGPGVPAPPPFIVWAHSEGLCDWVEGLGAYCRNESLFPQKLRELSVLIAARHFDSPFAWNAHYQQAIDLGISKDSLDRLARREDPQFAAADEQVFFQFGWEMLENHFVSEQTYQAALEMFTERGVVDLVGCIGSFSISSMMLNVFQVPMFDHWDPKPFADVDGFGRVDETTTNT